CCVTAKPGTTRRPARNRHCHRRSSAARRKHSSAAKRKEPCSRQRPRRDDIPVSRSTDHWLLESFAEVVRFGNRRVSSQLWLSEQTGDCLRRLSVTNGRRGVLRYLGRRHRTLAACLLAKAAAPQQRRSSHRRVHP